MFLALGFAFYVFFVPFVGKKLFQYVVMGLYTPLVSHFTHSNDPMPLFSLFYLLIFIVWIYHPVLFDGFLVAAFRVSPDPVDIAVKWVCPDF